MWALRRTSVHLRNQGLIPVTAQICSGKSEILRHCSENCHGELFQPRELFNGLLSSKRLCANSSNSYGEIRTFSSNAGAKSRVEEDNDLEEGFSELETPHDKAHESSSSDENEDDLIAGSESFEEGVVDEMLNGPDAEREKFPKKIVSPMTRAILAAPAETVGQVLDKWVNDGKEVTKSEMFNAMYHLRKRRSFYKALQVAEWVASNERLEFSGNGYAARVDLIAKVHGVSRAEEYLKQIPEAFRGELVYRTILASYVSVTNVKKSEDLFNKMKDMGFPISCFSCNQLLLLYKKTDRKKIADVLLLMEKENVRPSLFTYLILIDVKGSHDISGMEQIVETMKSEGLEPNFRIQESLARHYTAAGLKDKAEVVLKEMEGDDLMKKRWVCRILLPLYASLGSEDDVDRVWKVCESDAWQEEYLAAIEAWGQLNKIQNAEAAFDLLLKKVKTPSSKHFSVMLKMYANHNMYEKGKELVNRMAESGCTVGPLTWDALVKLYVGAGDVEKAASLLEKAIKLKRGKPLFPSFRIIMEKYADKGDVHNTEKIFMMMKQSGYVARIRQYETLLKAYVKANAPAYGFSDRLKADNMFLNETMTSLLAKVDVFRKRSAVDELLE